MASLISLLEAVHAPGCQSQDSDKASTTQDLLLRLSISDWLTRCAQNGCSGKTSSAHSRPMAGRISDPSSPRLTTSGILCRGLFLTQSFSEYRKDGAACLLADVLEKTGEVASRYFLSRKACAGILRRAEKRGKKIPEQLKAALESVANG